MINHAAASLPPQATSLDLSKAIFNFAEVNERNPHAVALAMIRTEVEQFF
jgi:hypothetical protein